MRDEQAIPDIATLARVAEAKERLRKQANPAPVKTPERRTIIEVNTQVGAGVDRTRELQTRALTTAEKMYHNGRITYEEWQLAGVLRNKYLGEVGSNSEGVGSYGDPKGSGSPWRKADAKAQAILKRNRTSTRELADLLWAMTGHHDEEGNKIYDRELATFVVRGCIETVDAITLSQIGKARTLLTGEKQVSAAGNAIFKECLRRGAAHMRFIRASEWRDSRWRVVDV